MRRIAWKTTDVAELLDAMDDDRLSEVIPAAPGVYMYRRRLRAPSNCLSSGQACLEWLKETTDQPAARLLRKPLAHCVWSDGLQVGGGGLTVDKLGTAIAACEKRAVRQTLIAFIESLSDFMPILYVGQTNSIVKRTSQHLNGETRLHEYVHEVLGLSWDELELRYAELGRSTDLSAEARAIQELFELIMQRILAPFATERPG